MLSSCYSKRYCIFVEDRLHKKAKNATKNKNLKSETKKTLYPSFYQHKRLIYG